MHVTELSTGKELTVSIERMPDGDYKLVTKKRFFFNWKLEKANNVFKLQLDGTGEILGIVSFIHYPKEKRLEIHLLAVSNENREKHKKYERIAGNLIAYGCREAYEHYAEDGAVSLIPKTAIRRHYIEKYGMIDVGWQLVLFRSSLVELIKV